MYSERVSITFQFVLLFLIFISSSAYSDSYSDEPIAYLGHGAMFDKEGNVIEPTLEFIQQAQDYYINKLYERATSDLKAQFDGYKSSLFDGSTWDSQSKLVANSALLQWLAQEVHPKEAFRVQGKNNFLKNKLRKQLSGPSIGNDFVLPQALKDKILAGASDKKIGRGVRGFSTMLSGQDYIDECKAAGVPIPPRWGSPLWEEVGQLDDEFIIEWSVAKVYKYEPSVTEGACIALPRIGLLGFGGIDALGIICLSKQTSKACFWDNQRPVSPGSDELEVFSIGTDEDVELSEFAGGAGLLNSANGICTDCHSGENPYVIHPGTALGMPDLGSLQINSDDWYEPLVHPSWPQNAGPINILENLPGAGDCTSCHYQGYAGRFPRISARIRGYCIDVLDKAVARTMPPGNPGDPAYFPHAAVLQGLCDIEPVPVLRVESIIDFKDVELGFSFKKALVIHNDGDDALTVSVNLVTDEDDTVMEHFPEVSESGSLIIQPGDDPLVLTYVFEPKALGAHSIEVEVLSDDPTTDRQPVTLTGNGVPPVPIDTMLVLDRSGSMQFLAGERKKIEAMRDAAMLYTDLLREDIGDTGTGDKLGYVKYNHNNSVYLPFDFITDDLKDTIESDELSDAALDNTSELKPDGDTGIGGAMETAANEIGGPVDERKQVMIVLTDGKENEEPYIEEVIDDIQSDNPNLQMYSVGLGFNIEPTKLQSITNMGTEGYHQVVSELTDVSLFELETFYFKIFANASGMDLVVDPTHSVNLLSPDTVFIDKATINSSDRRADFLVLDDPVLRNYYDLEFISPTGEVITPGTAIGGVSIQQMRRHTYTIYRVVFPEIEQEDSYVGDWVLQLKPNGKWDQGEIKRVMAESDINYSSYISPYEGKVPVGFAAAVASNYKLNVQLQPSSYLPGAEVRLTGALSDRGWPAVDGQIDVTVTAPDDSAYNITLHDDGNHNDMEANDAIWGNKFLQTGVPGVYKFFFQSIGHNERGELAPREATRYLTLMQPESPPEEKPCLPCKLLKILILIGLILLVMIWYCCCYKKRG